MSLTEMCSLRARGNVFNGVCVVACDWWPRRHHPSMLHIFHPPRRREEEKEKGRETTHWVGTGVQIRLPWQSLEVRCFVDVFLMTPVWLQAHCAALSDRQMGKADGLIWHTRKERRGLFFSVQLIEIPFLAKRFRENLCFWCWNKCLSKIPPQSLQWHWHPSASGAVEGWLINIQILVQILARRKPFIFIIWLRVTGHIPTRSWGWNQLVTEQGRRL